MGKRKRVSVSIGCVLFGAAIAIAVHILMPSGGTEVNVESFDSILVKALGFPAVATSYFVLLYLHIWFVVTRLSQTEKCSAKCVGWRLGLVFASLYMIGMQEIVVEASPLSSWGMDFVLYQFFIGLGDAIPALVICLVLAVIFLPKTEKSQSKPDKTKNHVLPVIVAVCVFAGRMTGYATGVVESDIERYPVQVVIWTIVFAVAMACYVSLLSPIARGEKGRRYIVVVGGMIGLNWIIFNSFMGMILKGTMPVMLVRSGMDVLAMAVGTGIALAISKTKKA